MRILIKFTLIVLPYFLINCSSNNNDFTSIEINFPLHKKAVYAICTYQDFGDSLVLENIEISSLIFNSTYSAGDTTFLEGTFSRNSDLNSAPISVASVDGWLLFEYSEITDAGLVFLKAAPKDTTSLPDKFHNHFPIIPHILKTNEDYSISRPANSGDEWGYAEVIRIFNSKDETTWSDFYDVNSGIEVEISHYLLSLNINFDTIFDQHGLVNSQSSYINYILNDSGELSDTTITYTVNRRIVDYQDEENVSDLQIYKALVMENGLTLNK